MANTKSGVDLIFCAAGSTFAPIAIETGWLYGAQLPGKVNHPIVFADQDWKKPDRKRYMEALAQHAPRMATVLDLERREQMDEVLAWAEEAAQYVTETIIIIPKVFGIIPELPREIGGREVRLGYSVPTRYGGTEIPVWEFAGWPVHLLGGSPHVQLRMANYLNVRSADCNYHMFIAQKFGDIWLPGGNVYRLPPGKKDNIYLAFAESCKNILEAWNERRKT